MVKMISINADTLGLREVSPLACYRLLSEGWRMEAAGVQV
jgi:hypothetical protein